MSQDVRKFFQIIFVIVYFGIGFAHVSGSDFWFSMNKLNDIYNGKEAFRDNVNPFLVDSLRTPLVVTAGNYVPPTVTAWDSLLQNESAVDAVVDGISVCETTDGLCGTQSSVGNDGISLDAMVMNGKTMKSGAVAGIRIKNAIRVAKSVLDYSKHTLLVGDYATDFGKNIGFGKRSFSIVNPFYEKRSERCPYGVLETYEGLHKCSKQKAAVESETLIQKQRFTVEEDTNQEFDDDHSMRMIVIDKNGVIAAGASGIRTTENIGSVGDSAIVGAAGYADADFGAAFAFGDGEILQSVLPSFVAVDEMRNGEHPFSAARLAIRRLKEADYTSHGAVLAVSKEGYYSGYCFGMDYFSFTVFNNILMEPTTLTASCAN